MRTRGMEKTQVVGMVIAQYPGIRYEVAAVIAQIDGKSVLMPVPDTTILDRIEEQLMVIAFPTGACYNKT